MALAARDAGFEVHVAAPQGKAAEILRTEGLPIPPYPDDPERFSPVERIFHYFDFVSPVPKD